MEVGIDGDDVDLPQHRRVVGVDLRPAEAGQPAVALVEQEPVRVEPRLLLPGLERVEVPAALLGMTGEGPVVDGEPGLLVLADDERPRLERRCVDRQRAAHLVQQATGGQPDLGGQLHVGLGGLEHPPVHVTASLAPDDLQGRVQQLRPDRHRLVAVVGMDDELEGPRVVAPADLGVGHRMVVPGLPRHQPGEARAPTLDQVEPGVVAEGVVVVGPLGGLQETADDRDVVGAHLALHLEAGHRPQATGGRSLRRRGTTEDAEGPSARGGPAAGRGVPRGDLRARPTATRSSCWRPRSCRPRPPTSG